MLEKTAKYNKVVNYFANNGKDGTLKNNCCVCWQIK